MAIVIRTARVIGTALLAVLLTAVSPGPAHPAAGFPDPVPGPLLADFEPPEPDWLPGHRGVDLAARAGTPVTTPVAGIVAYRGRVAGVPVLVVAHGAVRATYQPVSGAPPVGTQVAAGTVVGAVAGRGGHCAGRCLHWGLRSGEHYLDPRLLWGRTRVILVPEE